MDQPSERARFQSAAAETKNEDAILWAMLLHEKGVRLRNVARDAQPEREPEQHLDFLGPFRERAWFPNRADPGIVVRDLACRVALQRLEQTDNVGVVKTEVVVGAIETYDKIATHT